MKRLVFLLVAVPAVTTTLAGCGGGADDGAPSAPASGTSSDASALAWVTPSSDAIVRAGDPVELSVSTARRQAVVHFAIDGRELFSCDPSSDPNEDCRVGDLWRYTTVLEGTGDHLLTAAVEGGETIEMHLNVLAPDPSEQEAWMREVADGAELDAPAHVAPPEGAPADPELEAVSRGSLDPSRPYHDVFGGVSWAVSGQRVRVTHAPGGSVSAVSSCMHRYGASIRHWAGHFNLSRASVVATAITESGCSNPAGSSDGLSSGPLQVTASTCSSLTGLPRSTCRVRMHTHPDFSFYVGTKYMASSYQRRQHHRDPPKIAAAYNAGSIRRYFGNRWHMLVTGNHIERWVGAYNAYRTWEARVFHVGLDGVAPPPDANDVEPTFGGEHVALPEELPAGAIEGQVVFVGDWASRDGHFRERVGGRWVQLDEAEPGEADAVDP